MNLRQAAQQALEALEGADEIDCDMRDAINAIRTALAEPEQEPVAYVTGAYAGHFTVVPTNPALVLTTGMALYAHPVDDTALLRQALEALEWHIERGAWGQDLEGLTAALRERLGEKA